MRFSERKIWVAAAAAGAGLLALMALLFRPPAAMVRPPARPVPGLRLGSGRGAAPDPLFDDEAALRDPTPLFLPTEWNSSEKEVLRQGREGAFPSYEAKPAFRPDRLGLNLPAAVAVPGAPAEALEQNPPGHPYLGMGRAEGGIQALPARSAFVAITGVGTGRRVFGQAVRGLPAGMADLPPAGGAWEFLAAVDPAGLVGPLLETVRSGTPADDFFLKYLTETLQVGLRLSPGFYLISIGP